MTDKNNDFVFEEKIKINIYKMNVNEFYVVEAPTLKKSYIHAQRRISRFCSYITEKFRGVENRRYSTAVIKTENLTKIKIYRYE